MNKFLMALIIAVVFGGVAHAAVTTATFGDQNASKAYRMIADTDGVITLASDTTLTGGKIDALSIGSVTPAAGAFTTLAASSTLQVTGTQTLTGATYANGGVDRSTGAVLAIGATNATGVTVTPPATFSSYVAGPGAGYGTFTKRVRSTIAQVNAGVTLLAAVTGRQYRLVNVKMIAYGGAVTSTNVTHLEIRGTQSAGSAVLYKVAKAQLTQSTVNTIGTASTIILADGASFVACDANTAITLNPLAGTDAAGATGIDVDITYTVE